MNVLIDYTFESIAEIVKGTILQHRSSVAPHYLLLDSRKIVFPEETIFFALMSRQRNGTDFIQELYKKGVRNFVTRDAPDISECPGAGFIKVDDTLHALQLLAMHHRKRYGIMEDGKALPVIGITGSNGKTIVKEWLNQLLEKDFNIARSPKSYNSQIGVPLSVLQINAENTLAIFEAGISLPGEMENLAAIIQPTIGVFTNIGEAHSKGFENTTEKILEKYKLFKSCDVLICKKELLEDILEDKSNQLSVKNFIKFFSWSKSAADATLLIKHITRYPDLTEIEALHLERKILINIPFTDDAAVENAISCWCVLLHLGLSDEIIAARMMQLFPVEMRLELKEGINNCSIINDSYSADINSLSIALDFLQQQKQHPKHTVILSDILQSGKNETDLYKEISLLLRQKK